LDEYMADAESVTWCQGRVEVLGSGRVGLLVRESPERAWPL